MVWKRLNQIEAKPRQDQLQELRNEVSIYISIMNGIRITIVLLSTGKVKTSRFLDCVTDVGGPIYGMHF